MSIETADPTPPAAEADAAGSFLTVELLSQHAVAAGVVVEPPSRRLSFVPGHEAPPDPERDLSAVFAAPARVMVTDLTRASRDQLLEQVEGLALDPTVFQESPPFFWQCEISSNRLDSYFTYMSARTSLRNYAEDAARGVSFQDSHKSRELGFGRSFTGRFVNAQGDGVARTLADFYTIPGIRLNNVNTTDLIRGMRAGLVRDVSIGFSGGEFICSVCGRDMMRDYDCWHMPGFYYAPNDTDGIPVARTDKGAQLATATIENARLSEVSAVYDGATPGAAVLKAYRCAAADHLTPHDRRLLETRYRMALPSPRIQGRGAAFVAPPAPHHQEETPMAGVRTDGQSAGQVVETDLELEVADLGPIRAALDVAGAPEGESEVRRIAWLATERQRLAGQAEAVEQLRTQNAELTRRLATLEGSDLNARVTELLAEVDRLRPDAERGVRAAALEEELVALRPLREQVQQLQGEAEDGRTYRQDLLAEAMGEGVRAFGDGFSRDTYEPMLERAPLAVIKRMRDDWRAVADKRFPGGPQVETGEERPEQAPAEQAPARRAVPTSAYVS